MDTDDLINFLEWLDINKIVPHEADDGNGTHEDIANAYLTAREAGEV